MGINVCLANEITNLIIKFSSCRRCRKCWKLL